MKSTRTDKQVGVVGGEEGPGAGRGGIRMKCNPSWAEWCVCVCRVSTYFQLPFISCQKKGVFPLSMFIHHPIHLRLSLSPHPPHRPPSPSPPLSLLPPPLRNEEHFSFSAPFITPCCESVSKSVYMTDTGSQTLGYFRRLTTSVEICRDVKNTLTSTRSGAPPGRDTEHGKSSFFSGAS